jgi:hypothetical protein
MRQGGRKNIEEARDVYADSLWALPNDGWALFGQLAVCKALAKLDNKKEEACLPESFAFSDAWTTADIFLVDSATVKKQFNTIFLSVAIGLSFACGVGLLCVLMSCMLSAPCFGETDSGTTVQPLEERPPSE